MTIDPSVVEALDRFYNTHEMQIIRKHLHVVCEAEMTKAVKSNENTDVNRGRAQMILELVELFEKAPQEHDRLEKRNGTKKSGYPGHP